jgi:hypothetical protein
MKVSEIKRKTARIDSDKLYTIDEILATGLIVGRRLVPVRSKIYSLIRHGILPARNVSERWLVRGKDLKDYVSKTMA